MIKNSNIKRRGLFSGGCARVQFPGRLAFDEKIAVFVGKYWPAYSAFFTADFAGCFGILEQGQCGHKDGRENNFHCCVTEFVTLAVICRGGQA